MCAGTDTGDRGRRLEFGLGLRDRGGVCSIGSECCRFEEKAAVVTAGVSSDVRALCASGLREREKDAVADSSVGLDTRACGTGDALGLLANTSACSPSVVLAGSDRRAGCALVYMRDFSASDSCSMRVRPSGVSCDVTSTCLISGPLARSCNKGSVW